MKKNPNILEKTRKKLEISGIKYTKTDSGRFLALRWIYMLSIIWVSFFCLVMIIGHSVKLGNEEAIYSVAEKALLTNGLYFSSLLTSTLVVCAVFTALKKFIIPSIISGTLSIIGIIFYYNIYSGNIIAKGLSSAYFYSYGLPLLFITVCTVLMAVFTIRQRKIEDDAYDKLINKLYINYRERAKRLSDNSDEPITLTDAEWTEFLNSDELDFAPKKLKRSRKQKNK